MPPFDRNEDFRTLYVDPGEDTGWCIAKGTKLLGAGTTKLWPFADEVWKEVTHGASTLSRGNQPWLRKEVNPSDNTGVIRRFVLENFRLYPWKLRGLEWDEVRTARLIGALTFIARIMCIEIVFQPASIKDSAVAAGAEEMFCTPLHPNRHQNDATMHFVFYTLTSLAASMEAQDGEPTGRDRGEA